MTNPSPGFRRWAPAVIALALAACLSLVGAAGASPAGDRLDDVRQRVDDLLTKLKGRSSLSRRQLATLRSDLSEISDDLADLQDELDRGGWHRDNRPPVEHVDHGYPDNGDHNRDHDRDHRGGSGQSDWSQPYREMVRDHQLDKSAGMEWFVQQVEADAYEAPELAELGRYLRFSLSGNPRAEIAVMQYVSDKLPRQMSIPDPRSNVSGFVYAMDKAYALHNSSKNLTVILK
jgi:hypothetical protein